MAGVKLTAANAVNINNFDVCGGPSTGLRSITAPGISTLPPPPGRITRTVDDGVSLSGANVTLTAGTNIDSNFGDITATAGNVQATAVGTLNTTTLTVNSVAGNVTLNAGMRLLPTQ